MVAVLTRNTDSGDILGYDFGDKKDKDQMIRILAYEGVFLDPEKVDRLNENWTDDASKKEFKKLSRQVANDLSDQFDSQATMSNKIVYATAHASISFSPVDRERLGQEPYPNMYSEMEEIAREYMEKMDITDTQWVLTFHPGTRCPHMHLAYNRVRNDGTVISAKNERTRSMKACEKISAAHKLATGGEVERNLEALCDKRKVYAQMRLAALDALAESCTFDEFEANLRKKGILLTVTGQGLSYALESGEFYAKGSKLDRNALSYDKVEAALARNLVARQKAEEEAKAAAEKAAEEARIAALAAQEAARKAQEEAARAAEEKRRVAKRISTQPETFVIHGDSDATLYSNRSSSWPKNLEKLHEAARSILKYYTWGANVRINEPKEFVDDAVNGKVFGTVKFDVSKARFVGEDRYDGMLENPEEVIQFADHDGRALDLFTPDFHEFWRPRLDSLKRYLEERRNDQKAEEAARRKQEDIIEGYHSAVLPVGKQLYGLKKSAYELYMEAKDSGIGVSAATETVRKQLVETWRQNDEFNRQNREAKDRTDKVTAICGILTCLNPIVGLTAMFLASIVGDIHRASLMAQKRRLLYKVESLRAELTVLEEEKAALKIVKQERLQQYLDAKRMYQEYRNSLQTVDREVKAIESDIRVAEKTPPPAAKPVPESTPVQSPTATPAAQVTQPVAQVAQQQTAPTPPPAAKTYEIVLEFKANYYPYRIKKEQDGLLKLQKYEVDKKSPVVDGKHTGHLWYTKEKFTSYEEVGHDADGRYFKIKDTAGKTRYINQNGIDLDAKKKKQLGLVSKGFGSPTM